MNRLAAFGKREDSVYLLAFVRQLADHAMLWREVEVSVNDQLVCFFFVSGFTELGTRSKPIAVEQRGGCAARHQSGDRTKND